MQGKLDKCTLVLSKRNGRRFRNWAKTSKKHTDTYTQNRLAQSFSHIIIMRIYLFLTSSKTPQLRAPSTHVTLHSSHYCNHPSSSSNSSQLVKSVQYPLLELLCFEYFTTKIPPYPLWPKYPFRCCSSCWSSHYFSDPLPHFVTTPIATPANRLGGTLKWVMMLHLEPNQRCRLFFRKLKRDE